ncbi:exodeoxyribonuclease V subunit beta [Celerinatantimonas yamalensis]|uniref:RecBCD enzyme subunit RecB n=1 Tax=Celerinatantimonas yamalensis TaxID=559956 RepID=A0ABW9G705_9GAMM
MSEPLNLIDFPLVGARLIEASAGTGKTFTISALVLRLLLGDDPARQEPLNIDEILVVTFTEAATAELRGRIRARIHQARLDFLRGESGDFLTAHLLAQSRDLAQDAERLLIAEQNMDQASVFTIHGFCQRMLKEHAFESGIAFESEFLSAEYTLKLRAIEDCWRQSFYPLPKVLAARVMSFWQDPQSLLRSLQSVLAQPALQLEGGSDVDPQHWFTQRLAAIDAFKTLWQQQSGSLLDAIEQADLDKRSYSKKNLPNWLDELHSFAGQETTDEQLPKNIGRFCSAILFEKTKSGAPPSHPLIDAIDVLLSADLDLKAVLLAPLIILIRARFTELKAQLQQLGFDDLLSILAQALSTERDGVLAGSIRSQYPVAMIDEFQDTDPQQYRIFSHIYPTEAVHRHGLFLIGDPKQAIYGFRGADIFTYMHARQQVRAHYTLPVNYRSSGAMVNAVNALFAWHENPFIYRDAIEFVAVDSAPKHQHLNGLVVAGESQPALQFRLAQNGEPTMNNRDYQRLQSRDCASQIATWLTAGSLDEGNEVARTVQAGDIAVLVRTNREGQLIADALDTLSIPYVLRASRDSVFVSDEAYQLYLQLAAALNPNDERLLRAALATPLLGLSLTALEQLNNDELRWQYCVDEYIGYQRTWRQRGVLAMLFRWLEQRDIAGRILRERIGERQLTNLLHLGELLQTQSQQLDSKAALLRWFAEQLLDGSRDNDDAQIRLESDAKRVQIVTIHKSKGLEYPIVALPFILSFRAAKEAIYHKDGALTYALDQNDAAKEQAEQERLAEDLRLLYVALTRSKYHCMVGLGPVAARANKKGTTTIHQSALGFLLQRGQSGTQASLIEALEGLSQCSDISYAAVVSEWAEPLTPIVESSQSLSCRELKRRVPRNWWLTSYSALSRHHGQWDASTEMGWLDQTVVDEAHDEQERLDVFHFARGAQAGTFLHSIFELIDFQALDDEVQAKLSELMSQAGYEDKWLPVVAELRTQVLQAKLDDRGAHQPFCLAQLESTARLAEMEFVMPLALLRAREVNELLRQYDPLSARAKALNFEQLQGMLKGFIDLVFCVDGRYYVLDYKSNYLGDTAADYHQQAMEQAMVEHRYDFQYQIYALALTRMLRQRLPDYQYETHFGGVYYLFLRGVAGERDAQTGIYFSRPSEAFLNELDQLFAGDRG